MVIQAILNGVAELIAREENLLVEKNDNRTC